MQLYDLAGADGDDRFSPYCWRARLALAHKQFDIETVPWRYHEKDAIAPSGQGRVPVLVDGDRWVADSWAIACYLEDRYPDRPSLFGGGAGKAYCRYFSLLGDAHAAALFPILARDVLDHVHADDRAYFRETREARLGKTLEAAQADRDTSIDAFRASLAPLRNTLAEQPFLGGASATYADYAVFGQFQWGRCVSAAPLLTIDDPVYAWRDRLLDAFAGLARNVPHSEP